MIQINQLIFGTLEKTYLDLPTCFEKKGSAEFAYLGVRVKIQTDFTLSLSPSFNNAAAASISQI